MGGPARQADAFNRGVSRHHLAMAAIALVVSVALHATLIAGIDRFVVLPESGHHTERRFTAIEMADVRLTPPVPEERMERQPLDRPDVDIPPVSAGNASMTEFRAPEPLALPLPEPPAVPARVEEFTADATRSPAFRQEVLAIPEQTFPEDISALPRRWVDADIPKVDRAPDIQLPVDMASAASTSSSFDPAAALAYIEDPDAGTPDWSAVIAGRRHALGDDTGGFAAPSLRRQGPAGAMDERPEDVSRLQAIENLLQVRAFGYTPPDGDGSMYVALRIESASDNLLSTLPRDILFIQDSSESMTPWKLDECRRGLKRWMDFMNQGDRFEILGFSDDTKACFGGWREYNTTSRQEAFAFIDGLRASGNTDVYRSLQSALAVAPDPARTVILVLITDGRPTVGVIGSSDIIERVTRSNGGRVSIFTVGGGKKVNSFFLDLLSYRNRGDAMVVRGDEEIPGAMEAWAGQLRRPVLTDLTYSFSGIDASEIYPKQLTHLFLDRPLVIHGRIPKDSDRIVLQVVGRAGGSWHDMVFDIPRDQISQGTPELREQWAWQKAYHMIGDYIASGSDEKLAAIQAFAESHNLVVPYGFSKALPRK